MLQYNVMMEVFHDEIQTLEACGGANHKQIKLKHYQHNLDCKVQTISMLYIDIMSSRLWGHNRNLILPTTY